MRPAPSPLTFTFLALLTLSLPPARSAEAPATPTNPAPLPAPTAERERLQRIAAEVQRRRQLHEAALADARRLVAEHESRKTPATAEALAAAQKLIRDAETLRARTKPSTSNTSAYSDHPPESDTALGPNDRVILNLPDADMETVATVWKLYFNERVKISNRVKNKTVTATLDESFGVMRQKLEAVLLKHGIVAVDRPDGKYFDATPADPAP